MNTLDLHGVRHEKVENLVEDFVLTEDLPARIITGNSNVMIRIVQEVCARHNLHEIPENHYNLGSRIIMEQ
jgi:hypothetical protein